MAQTTSTPSLTSGQNSGVKPTNFRWVICGLLFYATTINYIDRSTLNSLEPTLRTIIHWRPYQYGLINAVNSLAYGLGFLIMGTLIDKVGTRIGYALAMIGWSLAGIATAFTSSPVQFGMARMFLGLFEAGNFPAAIKTTAEWFPQKQRATATGIFNAGSNVGAFVAPLIVLILVPMVGTWRAAFMVTPVLALIWIALWLTFYRNPASQPRANDAERALIEADPVTVSKPVKWRKILPHRQAWAFMVGKFMTDPVWWFYLYWSGAFLHDKFGVDLVGVALPLIYIYGLADLGSVAGGWLSSTLIKKGWSANAARKTAMLVCAGFVAPVIFAPMVPAGMSGGLWIAATLIGSAAAAHQGFSANMFTTASDMFPKRAVSSVTGLGGLAGALGGVILQSVAGVTIELTGGNYLPLFIVAACAYPIAIALIHFFAPRLEPASDQRLETTPMPRGVTAFIFAVLGFVVAVPLSYQFQNKTDYRLYDMKTMVTNTYVKDLPETIPASQKSLISASKVKEGKDPMSVEEKAKLASDAGESADFKEILNRQELKFKELIVSVEFKDNLSDADLAAIRKTYNVTEANSTYTPKVTEGDAKAPARLVIPFAAAGNGALAHFPKGFDFTQYVAAVLPPGDLFKGVDRAQFVPTLVISPLAGIALGAIIGLLLHGLIFPSRELQPQV